MYLNIRRDCSSVFCKDLQGTDEASGDVDNKGLT